MDLKVQYQCYDNMKNIIKMLVLFMYFIYNYNTSTAESFYIEIISRQILFLSEHIVPFPIKV